METTIKNGTIECSIHGPLTAIDCDSLQCDSCDGCFIYTALNSPSRDFVEFSLEEDTILNKNDSIN